jgi:hypothetical protein
MPNLSYRLTLQSEQLNSGPYYNVTYTTNSVYNPVLTGTPAYLPEVGDSVVVTIPSQSFSYLAFNLNNGIGSSCELCNNDVIFVITGSAPAQTFAYVSWSLNETLSPTVNADLLITLNGVNIVSQFTDASGSFNATSSATIFFQGYNSGSQSWPSSSTLFVTASKDGVKFFSGSSSVSGSIISSSFTALSGSTYLITVSSSFSGSVPAPTGYEYMGKFIASNTITCTPISPLKNLWLTTADSASYSAASNTFSAGMFLYSSAVGTAWSGGSRLFDQNNPAIWNVVSGELTTVYQFC